jgi:hypothetical protein
MTAATIREINTAIAHLRDVLGDPVDESLARVNDDHRRHGNLRIRPDRPGPSRTERRLETDEF